MATTDEPDRPGAQQWVPPDGDVEALRDAAPGCRGCELWAPATQVVFSRGPADADVVLVGEQPGDQEDLAGAPFVGPAGRVLVAALDEAGIARDRVYVTNAVKHFRFEQRGKRRIHQTPLVTHLRACLPWLEAELAAVRPRVVVALGATAGRGVLGRTVAVGKERGQVLEAGGRRVVVTAHPSSVLRLPEAADREAATAAIVADLRVAAAAAG